MTSVGGAAMCLVLLVVGLVALTAPFDPLGTPAAILILVVAAGGLLEVTRRTQRRR